MNIAETIKNILFAPSVWRTLLAVVPFVLVCAFLTYLLLYMLLREPAKVVLFVCGGAWFIWALSYLGELYAAQHTSEQEQYNEEDTHP